MSADVRRKIAQLRALAASTTFPAEAERARAKADQLEAELGSEPQLDIQHIYDAMAYSRGLDLQEAAARAAAWHREQEILRAQMRARWQAMFDEAMGRNRG